MDMCFHTDFVFCFLLLQMGKQTMGFPSHTLQYRNDHKMYRIQTPQSPLVRPYAHDFYGIDEYPLGTNAVVAVISYTVSGVCELQYN